VLSLTLETGAPIEVPDKRLELGQCAGMWLFGTRGFDRAVVAWDLDTEDWVGWVAVDALGDDFETVEDVRAAGRLVG